MTLRTRHFSKTSLNLVSWQTNPELLNRLSQIKSESLQQKIMEKFICTRSLLQELSSLPVEQLVLNQSYLLDPWPKLFSISHSSLLAVVYLNEDEQVLALGVDAEIKGRIIEERALKHFAFESETAQFSPLELWCRKEAAFKALYQFSSRSQASLPTSLKNICLDQEGRMQLDSKHVLQTKIIERDQHVIALALICSNGARPEWQDDDRE